MKKLFLILTFLLTNYLIFVFALDLNIDLNETDPNNVSIVHFDAPGNDFVGMIYFKGTKTITPQQSINLSGDSINGCKQLVQGYYSNSQRGDRVRPLDDSSLAVLTSINSGYNTLKISGGLYTNCNGTNEKNVYGQIVYNRSGTETYLIVGVDLDYPKNKYTNHLSGTFKKRQDNSQFYGYIRDSVGGIGSVNSNNNLTGERKGGICIEGFASLSCDKTSAIQSQTYSSNSTIIGIKDVLNPVRQQSYKACSSYKNLNSNKILELSNDPYLCYLEDNYDTGNILIIDLKNDQSLYNGKKIVVKNKDVILSGSMIINNQDLNLFIDNGNLFLPSQNSLQSFNENGYITTIGGVTSGIYLKGKIYVNGLILGGNSSNITGFNHKLYMEGTLASLNTPCDSSGKEKQIENLFKGSSIVTQLNKFINLENVFTWKCNTTNGLGKDGVYCGEDDKFDLCSLAIRKK